MKRTAKSLLWVGFVVASLSLVYHFAACSDDTAKDVVCYDCEPCYDKCPCISAGDPCATAMGMSGQCIEITPGIPECIAKCDTVGEACPDGTCYYESKSKLLICVPTGTKNAGDACGATADCIAGVQCLDLSYGYFCQQLCTDTCDYGECTDTGHGFSVCAAPFCIMACDAGTCGYTCTTGTCTDTGYGFSVCVATSGEDE
jgi:hypothetical protein